MPRRARVVLPGELFHVTQRGNYRQIIFEDDTERAYYLHLMEKYSQQYGLDIFAYCLMDNHVHFIVRPQTREALAQTFCRAHQQYSIYFHQQRKRRGHLWQERFYSCMLHGEHIKKAVRYVERNPVRAGMVKKPWDYSWSSARAHLGKQYKIITLHDISVYIDLKSWRNYLVEEEESKLLLDIRDMTVRGLVLGSPDFINSLTKKMKRDFWPKSRGRPRNSACH